MYEKKILELKKVPVFSLADVSQIVSGKEYAKKLLKRLLNSGEIFKIKKNLYTFHNDPFLVSSFIVKPSYISGVSALSYYKIISQIPKDIFCITLKNKKEFDFFSKIYFINSRSFFGFENKNYNCFLVPIATPEKAIIDSIGVVPLSVIEEAFDSIDKELIIKYLLKIKKSSTIKRIGFLLELNGYDVYSKLKKYINNRYLYLDPLAKKSGKKNKKWKIIINTK